MPSGGRSRREFHSLDLHHAPRDSYATSVAASPRRRNPRHRLISEEAAAAAPVRPAEGPRQVARSPPGGPDCRPCRHIARSVGTESDGLRALAVGSVILFHADLGLHGGFVGVDVFFVISGFLITSILLRELQSTGKVDLRNFWTRRIRRLLPALVTCAFVVAFAGWYLLIPQDYKTLGQSLAAQSVFRVLSAGVLG